MTLVLLSLLAACGTDASGDCGELPPGRALEECRYTRARAAAEQPEALDAALADIDDPASRDLLLLRLAVDLPARAPELCRRITTPAARDKCDKVVGRPHLGDVAR